jgi:hypothetical protein
MDDEQTLRELNEQMTEAENEGNRAWFDSVLAPRLAFQRADEARTIDDRDAFLQKLKPGGDRRNVTIGPIDVHGDRAIVQLIVATGGRRFHNLRLFVRRDGGWKLLGWANEPV